MWNNNYVLTLSSFVDTMWSRMRKIICNCSAVIIVIIFPLGTLLSIECVYLSKWINGIAFNVINKWRNIITSKAVISFHAFTGFEQMEYAVVKWRITKYAKHMHFQYFKIQNEYSISTIYIYDLNCVAFENSSKIHHFQFFYTHSFWSINEAIKWLGNVRSASSILHDDMIKAEHWNMGNKSNKKNSWCQTPTKSIERSKAIQMKWNENICAVLI